MKGIFMITLTEAAKNKILELIQAENQPGLALRVSIAGRGPGGFEYGLAFAKEEDTNVEDAVIDAGGFKVLVDAKSAAHLKGATVDYVTGLYGSGFKIENPNSIWSDPLAAAVQRVIDAQINPGIASHGGLVTLLDVKDNVAYIAFGGGCQGCGMVDVTLRQGVVVMIKEAVPAIREVVDTTDHASGRNPYYQQSNSGQSPLV
jgi:Fe/S biogenesis protein NfuA